MTRHTYSRPSGNISQIMSRLTIRDHTIIALLGDHRVLTTHQLTTALFGSPTRARTRLLVLYRLGLLDRFRSRLLPGAGTEQWHWVLAPLGARLHAAARGEAPPRPARVADMLMRTASHPHLAHTLGANDFFIRIMAACRARPDAELTAWSSHTHAGRARPDAEATYSQGRQCLDFYFEHDRGTETLTTLVKKLDRYRDAAILTQPRPVLFELPTPARETHFQHMLTDHRTPAVATTHTDLAHDPTEEVWWQPRRAARVCLIDIPTSSQ